MMANCSCGTATNPTADDVIVAPEDFCMCLFLAVYIFFVRARRYCNSSYEESQINPLIQSLTFPAFFSNQTIWTPRWPPAPTGNYNSRLKQCQQWPCVVVQLSCDDALACCWCAGRTVVAPWEVGVSLGFGGEGRGGEHFLAEWRS